MVSRSEKVAGTMEQLLGGGEVYHYHTKLMMKEAHTGGSFVWHQDYGYIGVWVHTAWGWGGGVFCLSPRLYGYIDVCLGVPLSGIRTMHDIYRACS